MTVSEIMQKMIAFSNGNRHDINHLLKVWGYAKTIGDAERLDADTLFILETAAITHDIAWSALPRKIRQYQRQVSGSRG